MKKRAGPVSSRRGPGPNLQHLNLGPGLGRGDGLLMWPVLVVATLFASAAFAQDRAAIDRTQIIGNRELPKVLYIVPWKKPLPGELAGRPLQSVLDEALAPIDRDVFRRQLQYDAATRVEPAAQTAGGKQQVF